ncbi:MAG: UDP-N-acetylmuramoyl-tripeptide--D-alanyl-D-alanine ligase [Phycisphaerales bacterium]|nr:UDP-N-acetylmuramoyl-tripeptide--D-alanyl-D-alanine ligase [Phycisphaerales bacterium]
MMFSAAELVTITGGRWAGQPPASGPLCIGHDTRESLDGGLYVAIRGDRLDGHDFIEQAVEAGASMAMVDREREASIPCLVVPDTVAALGQLASAWRDRLQTTTVIAITGTAGKTSTKDLLAHVLGSVHQGTASPASWNNAIGGPMSLLRARPEHDHVILELGTSSPGEIPALAEITRPDIAIITLVGHGHLEGLGSLDGVRAEKCSLLKRIAPGGVAIVHDDGHEVDVPEGVRLLRHGDEPGSMPRLLSRADGRIHLADGADFALPLPGQHHAINALAVIATARIIGLSDAQVEAALASATPSDSRGTDTTIAGVRFINDAYNANPESVAAALSTFPEITTAGRRIIVLGDMLELGGDSARQHAGLAAHVQASHARAPVDEILLVGEAIGALNEALDPFPARAHWALADEAAMTQVAQRLRSGDLVLLKASRGIQLERIMSYVRERESEVAAT